MQPTVLVSSSDPTLAQQAQWLAAQLGLDYIADPLSNVAKNADYLLIFTPNYLGIKAQQHQKTSPFYIDFTSGKLRYRMKAASLRRELLAKAIGIHPRDKPFIVDATAGVGRDSFILASLDYEITLIERSPIVHALLRDGLDRASNCSEIATIMKHLHLIHGNSITWLPNHLASSGQQPDIILLDPMFPDRKKSASVKKEMAILNNLLGSDDNPEALLKVAIASARKRVVVKRPRFAIPLTPDGRKPHFSLSGTTSRFDIYLPERLP